MFRLDENNVQMVVGQVYLLHITQWIKFKNDAEFMVPMYFLGNEGEYPTFSNAYKVEGYDNSTLFPAMTIGRDFFESDTAFGTVKIETALARKPTAAVRGHGNG